MVCLVKKVEESACFVFGMCYICRESIFKYMENRQITLHGVASPYIDKAKTIELWNNRK